ncbi:unnamed protein product [Polarella glacialis]|nr:unnamed protein product [Polarella glacialis]
MLIFFTLLITSILPCLMGLVKQEFEVPEVSVNAANESAEGQKHGNWLGSLVSKAVQSYDTKKALGVDVTFGSISVHVSTGEVEITDLVVGSPDGYYSPLLQISKVLVDLDMSKLMYSLGSEVEVEKTAIENFTLTIEKTFTTSNLNDFLKFLSSSNENLKQGTSAPQEPEAPHQEEQSGGFFSRWFSPKKGKQSKSNRTMTLREVSLRHIGVKMGFYCLAGQGISLRAGDLAYSDFDTQMCKSMGNTTAPLDIIPFLVMTLLRTILDNVLGDRITEAVQQGVVDACTDVMNSTAVVNSSLVAGVQEGAAKVGEVVAAGADAGEAVVHAGGAAANAGAVAVLSASDAVVNAAGAAVYSVSSAAASTASSLLPVSGSSKSAVIVTGHGVN